MALATVTYYSDTQQAVWHVTVSSDELDRLCNIPESYSLSDSNGEVSSCYRGTLGEVSTLCHNNNLMRLSYTSNASVNEVIVHHNNTYHFAHQFTLDAPVKVRLTAIMIDSEKHICDTIVSGISKLRIISTPVPLDANGKMMLSEVNKTCGIISTVTGQRGYHMGDL